MHPFASSITLRVRGGDFQPSTVSQTLGLKPRNAWLKGDPIINPPGTPPRGIRKITYWSHHFEQDETDDRDFGEFLTSILSSLSSHRDFFAQLRAVGCVPGLFIGLFSNKNFGFTISHAHTTAIHTLMLDLEFDIYPQ